MSLKEKVKSIIEEYRLAEKGDKIVVGVSGGPDSLALLYLLDSLKKELGISLFVAHLNHGLRPDASLDQRFVHETCQRLKLPFYTKTSQIRKNGRKDSWEQAARKTRFAFFFEVAKKIKAKKIALAHTLDDQAETVLMRLLRGSGLAGLAGMLPKREINGFVLIRPLLFLTKTELLNYLRRKRVAPRFDLTNRQDIYLRNKIRQRLIPLLEKEYNPKIKEILSQTSFLVASDYDYLSKIAQDKLQRYGSRDSLPLKKLTKSHPALVRMLIILMIEKIMGTRRRIEYRHIKEIEELIHQRPLGSVVSLPGQLAVAKKEDRLLFKKVS